MENFYGIVSGSMAIHKIAFADELPEGDIVVHDAGITHRKTGEQERKIVAATIEL